MISVKPVRTDEDLAQALARIERLMGAPPGSAEADELEVLAQLVEAYERTRFPIRVPTPVDAIRFRMEQKGLQGRDLVPLLGSRARVSQVLNGQRPLSIDMIRALHGHLGIPADVLIAPQDEGAGGEPELAKPAARMLRELGLLQVGETLRSFLARAAGPGPAAAMYRRTRTQRTNAKTDPAALSAWCAAALLESRRWKADGPFSPEALGPDDLRELARLSRLTDGPRRARDWLRRRGVVLVTLPHLPGTYLDGAAMMREDEVPVVALTLRRDRVDNFWFTLLHECVHVARHLSLGDMILDDLEIESGADLEREADCGAGAALVPEEAWRSFGGGRYVAAAEIVALADTLGVNPAVVAGRWQMENRDFRRFSKMLGHGEIRLWFDLPDRCAS